MNKFNFIWIDVKIRILSMSGSKCIRVGPNLIMTIKIHIIGMSHKNEQNTFPLNLLTRHAHNYGKTSRCIFEYLVLFYRF